MFPPPLLFRDPSRDSTVTADALGKVISSFHVMHARCFHDFAYSPSDILFNPSLFFYLNSLSRAFSFFFPRKVTRDRQLRDFLKKRYPQKKQHFTFFVVEENVVMCTRNGPRSLFISLNPPTCVFVSLWLLKSPLCSGLSHLCMLGVFVLRRKDDPESLFIYHIPTPYLVCRFCLSNYVC